MSISIALATYNGERYIAEQLESILPQIASEDEIIISDDGSTDRTVEIINGFGCAQIHIYRNPGKGIISNFENAIRQTKGELIFLCDQDDVWCAEKVKTIKSYFSSTDIGLVVSDAYITDGDLNIIDPSFYKSRNSESGFIKNFIKNTYVGCCMTFRKELKEVILPFPDKIPMHDSWTGLLAELNGKVLFIPERLVYYRRHAANATSMARASLRQSILWRINLAVELFKRQFSIK